MPHRKVPPTAIAVIASFAVVGVIFVLGGSIIGSYLLMVHYVHSFTIHEMQVQLKAAVQSCKALRALDNSHNGIVFPKINPGHPSELALTRMFKGIHEVYVSSQCPQILSGHFRPQG